MAKPVVWLQCFFLATTNVVLNDKLKLRDRSKYWNLEKRWYYELSGVPYKKPSRIPKCKNTPKQIQTLSTSHHFLVKPKQKWSTYPRFKHPLGDLDAIFWRLFFHAWNTVFEFFDDVIGSRLFCTAVLEVHILELVVWDKNGGVIQQTMIFEGLIANNFWILVFFLNI